LMDRQCSDAGVRKY